MSTFTCPLLLEESPLQVLPSLAVAIGLAPALILQQLHYKLRTKGHEIEGERWFYNTHEQWHAEFPFLSLPTVKRVFAQLKKRGLIKVRHDLNQHGYDTTSWYAIDYPALNALKGLGPQQPQGSINLIQRDGSICADASDHFDTPPQDLQEISKTNTQTAHAREDGRHGGLNGHTITHGQTAHAREDDTLVAHESPIGEPHSQCDSMESPEDETPCVCEDESMAEEPEALPEPIAEPEPQAEAFAWEAPTCTYDPIVPCRHYRATLAAIEPLVPFRVTGNGQRVNEEVYEAAHRLSPEQITRIYDYRVAQKHSPEVLYPSVTLARKSLDKWCDLAEAWEQARQPPAVCKHLDWKPVAGRYVCLVCGKDQGEAVGQVDIHAFVERFAPSWEEPQDAA